MGVLLYGVRVIKEVRHRKSLEKWVIVEYTVENWKIREDDVTLKSTLVSVTNKWDLGRDRGLGPYHGPESLTRHLKKFIKLWFYQDEWEKGISFSQTSSKITRSISLNLFLITLTPVLTRRIYLRGEKVSRDLQKVNMYIL